MLQCYEATKKYQDNVHNERERGGINIKINKNGFSCLGLDFRKNKGEERESVEMNAKGSKILKQSDFPFLSFSS